MSDGACDYDEPAHGRNWILTRLSPPVTVELCDEHLAPGLIGLLAADLGVEFADLYGAIERFLAREAKKADKALADAQAAEGQAPDGLVPDAPGGDDDPGSPEVIDNDGVTVVVPDTRGADL